MQQKKSNRKEGTSSLSAICQLLGFSIVGLSLAWWMVHCV